MQISYATAGMGPARNFHGRLGAVSFEQELGRRDLLLRPPDFQSSCCIVLAGASESVGFDQPRKPSANDTATAKKGAARTLLRTRVLLLHSLI